MGGTLWIYFFINDNKSFYFGSFGWQADRFLLNQPPKPFQNVETQFTNNRLPGTYCLHFFYLKKIKNYDAFQKKYFD